MSQLRPPNGHASPINSWMIRHPLPGFATLYLIMLDLTSRQETRPSHSRGLNFLEEVNTIGERPIGKKI